MSALRIVGQAAAGAGIRGAGIAVRRGERLGDVGAGAKAGIDQAPRLQFVERRGVVRRSLRLDQRRLVGLDTEPGKILGDAGDEFSAAAGRIEILDPEEKLAAAPSCLSMAERRGQGVAEVKPTRGRGSKSGGRLLQKRLLTVIRGSCCHAIVKPGWHPARD